MKFNFKKITAITASILMTGMTLGIASAANFPAPFVDNNVADVAIVYGTGVDVSLVDQTSAGNIQSALDAAMPSTGGTITGESYKFEKTSTKFHLGDHYINITTNLDEDELPTLLADGKYLDNDNDEIDYTQKVTMGSLGQLMMFEDGEYMEDVPSIGFRIPSSQEILTYELSFSDTLLMTDMSATNLPFMGKEYYVLSNTSTTLTLLDSAEETILSEGETITLGGKTVSVEYIGSSEVKLNVDGQITTSLAELATFHLNDGSYVGIKDIMYNAVQGADNKVEFSIGSGKLKLTDGGSTSVQINDNSVSGLVSDFTLANNTLSLINLTWSADNDVFITEDSEVTMPGFEILKLSYGGLDYPVEETIEVKQGGDTYAVLENFPLKDSVEDINFIYGNSTHFTAVGKDSTNKLLTDDNNDGNITFTDLNADDYFVVSWTDTTDAESYLMKATNFVDDSGTDKFDLKYKKDGTWVDKKTGVKSADTISIGSVDLTIGAIDRTAKTVEIWNTSANTDTSITSFNTLYSKEGLTVYLPWLNTTALNYSAQAAIATAVLACDAAQALAVDQIGELGYAGVVTYNGTANANYSYQNTTTCVPEGTTFVLKMHEEDKSENKYSGDYINVTLGWDSSSTPEVEVSDIVNEEVTFKEIGDTDVWRSFMYSALATEMLWNKPSSGQKSIKIMYHGDEVAADVYITSPDATIGGGSVGDVLVTDAEIASVQTKNLIIVGGSCINSAAANVLGVAEHTCAEAFTSATDIGAGQFLIQSFGDAYTTDKIALLVAGYAVGDTSNAATYLKTQTVDTTAGNKYVGTTSTTAELIVA